MFIELGHSLASEPASVNLTFASICCDGARNISMLANQFSHTLVIEGSLSAAPNLPWFILHRRHSAI